MENNLACPQTLKYKITIWELPYPKELKTDIEASTCTHMLIAVLPTGAKRWKQFKHPSIDERINQL